MRRVPHLLSHHMAPRASEEHRAIAAEARAGAELVHAGAIAVVPAAEMELHAAAVPLRDERRGNEQQGREAPAQGDGRSEEHTSELQSLAYLVCRLLLEKKKKKERST